MAEETTLIQGDTYPVRDQLKALGGRWDATAKGWRVPNERAAEAKDLVESAAPRRGRMRGELWQECYCGTEPVCSACFRCERHCAC